MPLAHRPADVAALCEIVADAVARDAKLAIRGGGSKAPIGRDTPAAKTLDMAAFTGIVDYDPAELVLTLGAATPLAEVQALVASQGQMLAFDPFDHAAMLGTAPASATIGGVIAAGVAGPLRLSGGGARDHLLGFEAVSGRAEHFVAGARVVKNVTGYDLSKLVTGSWGRLVALTQLTLKVLPRPRVTRTLLLRGLAPADAVAVMARAMGSAAEVVAAAHLPAHPDGPTTALRLHGFPASVDARRSMLDGIVGASTCIDEDESRALWDDIAIAKSLPAAPPLWRVILPPRHAPAFVSAIGGDWLMDWAGGLIWLASNRDAATIRGAATDALGHAAFIRADPARCSAIPAFHQPSAALSTLEARVRRAFDPAGVFETGRF